MVLNGPSQQKKKKPRVFHIKPLFMSVDKQAESCFPFHPAKVAFANKRWQMKIIMERAFSFLPSSHCFNKKSTL